MPTNYFMAPLSEQHLGWSSATPAHTETVSDQPHKDKLDLAGWNFVNVKKEWTEGSKSRVIKYYIVFFCAGIGIAAAISVLVWLVRRYT
jgi:hypothetical protein